MTHLGLFEGIGGFSLAARWAGWTTPVMVEWNPYCQAVLKKNFPDATIFGDIHEFDGAQYAGQIDIITGGFPCQPYSHAGKRAGNDDDRALWPEMLRVIQEVAPAWVVGENVAGLLTMDGGRVFAGILADLENAGYSTETYLIPAIGVGAPHRRDRVWIVAHSDGANDFRKIGGGATKAGSLPKVDRPEHIAAGRAWGADSRTTPHCDHIERNRRGGAWNGRAELANEDSGHTSDAAIGRRQRGQDNERQGQANGIGAEKCDCGHIANPNQPRLEKRKGQPGNNGQKRQAAIGNVWSEHWYEVATRICGVDDGLSARLDGIGGVPKATTKGKAHRLEALGNAIVPQIAYQIFDAINQYNP